MTTAAMTTAAPTKSRGELRVREIGAAEYDRWEGLVAASPVGSIYSSPAYLDVFCAAAGGRFRVHVVESGDRWVGDIALHEQVHARKRAPLYLPKCEFETWFARLHEAGLVRQCNARDASGDLVASQLMLHSKHPVAHTVAAAADAQRQQGGANAWLRWQSFSALAAAGYTANDLTGAELGSVAHFKSQLGGELQVGWALSRPDALSLRFFDGSYALRARLLPT